jgi:phosphoribosylglycinamide formyltransferase-1
MALPEADEVVLPRHALLRHHQAARNSLMFRSTTMATAKPRLLVKISGAEEQAMLIDSDEDRYYRPAYFGDGWIGIRLDLGDTDWDHIADWLAKSWRAVAPKKLTKLMPTISSGLKK